MLERPASAAPPPEALAPLRSSPRRSANLRVLLMAEECNPEWASLPGVGYRFCKAIAEQADVVVATHVRNRPAITRAGMGRARVEYIDNEYVAAPLYRFAKLVRGGDQVAWTANVALSYPATLAFEHEVWKRFGVALDRREFDVVHRVTPMSPAIPSPMARWSPVPFVLGPLNGGLRWPPGFAGELRREREWLTYVRGSYRFLPYYRSTYRKASAILAAFGHTITDLPPAALPRVIDFPEVGFDPDLFSAPARRGRTDRTVFLFVGRLVPYKCADVLVEAFARREELRRHRLIIVGEGPERGRLESLVAQHRLQGCVELLGWKTQPEVGSLMRTADVFAFPSVRELGAGVVVEAMAAGLPCLVVDYGGPGGLVSESTGVKLPLGEKSRLVEDFAREMKRLADEPDLRLGLGAEAAQRALGDFTWEAKARWALEVYEWVLGRRPEKPARRSRRLEAAAPWPS